MMNALKNKVQLIGNLGQDPEIVTLENGNRLAKFSIATSDYYKNAKGEKVEAAPKKGRPYDSRYASRRKKEAKETSEMTPKNREDLKKIIAICDLLEINIKDFAR